MKRFEFMIRGAIAALAGFGVLALCPAANAQSVTVKDSTGNSAFSSVCTSAPALSMDPAGVLIITCTPNSTGVLQPPSCTVPNTTVQVGSTAIVSASCGGGAVATYAWTNPGTAAPGFTATNTASQQVSGPFTTAMVGNIYTFSMTAANTAGTSPAATGTLTVVPASTTGSCANTAVTMAFSGNSAQNGASGQSPAIPRGGYNAFQLPIFTAVAHQYLVFASAQDTRSASNLGTQFAISTCPGDFNVSTLCQAYGVADTGSTGLYAFADPAMSSRACIMTAGTQYYLNVRNVQSDLVTPSCTVSNCYITVQMHLGFY